MTSNGRSVVVITDDNTTISDEVIRRSGEQVGVALAPWARGFVMRNTYFPAPEA